MVLSTTLLTARQRLSLPSDSLRIRKVRDTTRRTGKGNIAKSLASGNYTCWPFSYWLPSASVPVSEVRLPDHDSRDVYLDGHLCRMDGYICDNRARWRAVIRIHFIRLLRRCGLNPIFSAVLTSPIGITLGRVALIWVNNQVRAGSDTLGARSWSFC